MATAPIADQQIRLRPASESPGAADGFRILIDRLWPGGPERSSLRVDGWLKNAAPSTRLRRWYGHDPEKWTEFQLRYRRELAAHPKALACLLDAAHIGPITLVYTAGDEQRNDAVVLKEVVDERLW